MPIVLHEPEFEALARSARHHEVSHLGLHGYESACHLPGESGVLRVAHTSWADQVRCFVFEHEMMDDVDLLLTGNRDNRISFFIDGDVAMRHLPASRAVDIRNGNAILRSSHAADEYVVRLPKENSHTVVQLRMNRELFDAWMVRSAVQAHEKVMDDLHVYDGRVAYNGQWGSEISECLRAIRGSKLRGELRLSYLAAKSVELLTVFTRQLTEPREDQGERTSKVHRAHAALTEDLTRSISVSELARMVNWNATDLQVEFKKEFGLPVHSYLKSIRLQRAARLLSETSQSVFEVAMDTGWQCQSRFASAFRAHFGTTPTGYRMHAASGWRQGKCH
jgi:AraC-like DNA-binding protein